MDVNDFWQKVNLVQRGDRDLALLKKALDFASRYHAGQNRESGEPYFSHPLAVATRLAEMRLDAYTISASLLHDVCEDTSCTPANLEKEFGSEVARLVEGVTKLDRLNYRGTERNAESLRKMFLAIAEDVRIVLLKLLDRRHNLETLQHLAPEKQKRIALETLEIYAPLAYRLGIGELKGQLEDLAFPYVYPQEHEWLMKTLKDHFEDRQKYVEKLEPVVAQRLTEEKIKFLDIHARAKHYYSLYKKLLKYDMDLNKVFDLIAIRVIVQNLEDCYAALGIIHKLWRPLPGLVKDYIALPKPNGYRSLHTSVFGPEGRVVEFQIRTQEMHEEAENGIAAHWAYAEKKGSRIYAQGLASFAPEKELFWIQQLKEWQKDFAEPDEFLKALKIDFFKNRIFVLSPKGDVFDLPEGATPIDFAYAVHTEIGHTATGAKVNSKMTALSHILKNGDVVEILTQKNKKPSYDWLNFIKSAQAKKKIGAYLKKARRAEFWEERKPELVEFRVTARDRIGLIRDISDVFSNQKLNIKNISTDTRNKLWPVLAVLTSVKKQNELEKMMVKLKEIKGVEEVNYKLP